MINQEQTQYRRVLTVTQLNAYVRSMIEGDFRLKNIFVSGEISNLKDHYSSGHIYLTLKDRGASINSVIFATNARKLRFKLENGMKVICHGRISLYEANGQYQMYIDSVEPVGIGALYLAFEQLKSKLEAKGLFSVEHKKPIKRIPKTLAVITSPTGAVIQDIRNVISRRFPYVKIILYPVTVQGEDAPRQIIEALSLINAEGSADTVIIARGGGSMEDLWAFNNESLAVAVFNSKIPVISAVGHETDFTICDFVSDLRAPTPSAAAELAVPDVVELKRKIINYYKYLGKLLTSYRQTYLNSLYELYSELCLYLPINLQGESFNELKKLINRQHELMAVTLSESEKTLNAYTSKLEELNPVIVLSRGYAYVYKDEKQIQSAASLKKGDEITIYLSDGSVKAIVQ